MNRTVGIQPMSEKRRAEFVSAGKPYPSSTLDKPVQAPKRSGKRPADTGPDQATVNAVLGRDGHQCVRCGGALWGDRGEHWSIQHRRARGNGGTQRPDANAPQTLIALCGSATTGCHGWIESNRTEAEANGWAVKSNDDPLLKPVQHSLHGWVFLTANGGWQTRRPSQPSDSEE